MADCLSQFTISLQFDFLSISSSFIFFIFNFFFLQLLIILLICVLIKLTLNSSREYTTYLRHIICFILLFLIIIIPFFSRRLFLFFFSLFLSIPQWIAFFLINFLFSICCAYNSFFFFIHSVRFLFISSSG